MTLATMPGRGFKSSKVAGGLLVCVLLANAKRKQQLTKHLNMKFYLKVQILKRNIAVRLQVTFIRCDQIDRK